MSEIGKWYERDAPYYHVIGSLYCLSEILCKSFKLAYVENNTH